jgi:hypothetical protein
VKWDDKTQMCSRWVIMGRCFNDCHNAASHVQKEAVPADKLTTFKDYLKLCRSNWLSGSELRSVRPPTLPPKMPPENLSLNHLAK